MKLLFVLLGILACSAASAPRAPFAVEILNVIRNFFHRDSTSPRTINVSTSHPQPTVQGKEIEEIKIAEAQDPNVSTSNKHVTSIKTPGYIDSTAYRKLHDTLSNPKNEVEEIEEVDEEEVEDAGQNFDASVENDDTIETNDHHHSTASEKPNDTLFNPKNEVEEIEEVDEEEVEDAGQNLDASVEDDDTIETNDHHHSTASEKPNDTLFNPKNEVVEIEEVDEEEVEDAEQNLDASVEDDDTIELNDFHKSTASVKLNATPSRSKSKVEEVEEVDEEEVEDAGQNLDASIIDDDTIETNEQEIQRKKVVENKVDGRQVQVPYFYARRPLYQWFFTYRGRK